MPKLGLDEVFSKSFVLVVNAAKGGKHTHKDILTYFRHIVMEFDKGIAHLRKSFGLAQLSKRWMGQHQQHKLL